MIVFTIKYCQKKDGAFVDVTPDIAHCFRVFMITRTEKRWVHDFTMLSKANVFIEKIREAEIKLHEAFAAVLAGRSHPFITVMESLKREIVREEMDMAKEFFRHKKLLEEQETP
jgi:hypothetical protein